MEGVNYYASYLSPLSLLKYLSPQTPTQNAPSLPTHEFEQYLTTFAKEYSLYIKNKHRPQLSQENAERDRALEDATISKIGGEYFRDDWSLELPPNKDGRQSIRVQQEWLDEIEGLIYWKTCKYPAKSIQILRDLHAMTSNIAIASSKVHAYRCILRDKFRKDIQERLAILKRASTIKNIQKTISLVQILKKLSIIKNTNSSKSMNLEELLQVISKKQLQQCENVLCVNRIISNVEDYRTKIRAGILKQFNAELHATLSYLLHYDKSQLSKPSPTQQNPDRSLEITVLDQSYFVFEDNHNQLQKTAKNVGKLRQLWALMVKFEIDETEQIHQAITKFFIKHNVQFNQDMRDFLALTPNLQNPGSPDLRQYIKCCEFYYQMLNRFLVFSHRNQDLGFLGVYTPKMEEFILDRATHFAAGYSISYATPSAQFLAYLSILTYWDMHDNLSEPLAKYEKKIITDYLTEVQKNLLVVKLKTAIEQSDFTPVSIPVELYVTFFNAVGCKGPNENFKIIDKELVYQGETYKVPDSFLIVVEKLEQYLGLREELGCYQEEVEEKICDLVGFYVWFNQNYFTKLSTHANPKIVSKLCVFYSSVKFMRLIYQKLKISIKKADKTNSQIRQGIEKTEKMISWVPLTLIEGQIASLYEQSLKMRFQVPAIESKNIINTFSMTLQALQGFFNYDQITFLLADSAKIVSKNYFNYLLSLEKRGYSQLQWFINQFKGIMLKQKTNHNAYSQTKIEKAQEIYLFSKEVTNMEYALRVKQNK